MAYTFDIVISSDSTTSVYFTPTVTGSHSLKLLLVDSEGHGDGFCLTSIVLSSATVTDFIDRIEYLDCDGNYTEVAYGSQTNEDNILIQLPAPASCLNKVVVTDTDGNQFESVWIRSLDMITMSQCSRNQLLKLNWFDTCTLDNVDYANLPFINEVYLYGSIKEVNNIDKERVRFTSPTGAIEPVFSHSLDSETITIANYSNTLHRLIAKIFNHKYFYVNDERGKMDSGKYEIIKLQDGNATGEVEFILDGSELVNSSCCC